MPGLAAKLGVIHRHLVARQQQADESLPLTIMKRQEDERIVLGVVLAPDEVDGQRDKMTTEEIAKTAHRFMRQSQQLRLNHVQKGEERVALLESYVAPVPFELNGQQVPQGAWLMAVRVEDKALWKQVKSGDFTGFSIRGIGKRRSAMAAV